MIQRSDWEQIDNDGFLFRLHIQGGWLVKVLEDVCHEKEYQGLVPGWDYRVGLAFVPDPDHAWKP